jgi:hypothetical protein
METFRLKKRYEAMHNGKARNVASRRIGRWIHNNLPPDVWQLTLASLPVSHDWEFKPNHIHNVHWPIA